MAGFIESLESRTLLSAAPHKADSPTIAQDKAAILIQKNNIKEDKLGGKATAASDRAGLLAALATQKTLIKNDQLQIKTDKGNATQVAADRAKLTADKAGIKAIQANYKATVANHRANTKGAIATDTATLKVALAKLALDRRTHA
jgi:hypothetical protein